MNGGWSPPPPRGHRGLCPVINSRLNYTASLPPQANCGSALGNGVRKHAWVGGTRAPRSAKRRALRQPGLSRQKGRLSCYRPSAGPRSCGSPSPAGAAGSCLVCLLAGGAAAAFVCCLLQPPGLFPSRQSPVLPTDFCLFFPPSQLLKAAPGGRGAGSSAGGAAARPAVPATKVAFTNEREDPLIMGLIIANIGRGLAVKPPKKKKKNTLLAKAQQFGSFFLSLSPP